MLSELLPFVLLNNAMTIVYMHILFSDFLPFHNFILLLFMSLLLLSVTLWGGI